MKRSNSQSSDPPGSNGEIGSATTYRLLSLAVSYPDQRTIDLVRDSTLSLDHEKTSRHHGLFEKFLSNIDNVPQPVVEAEYNRLFVESGLPPYETEYGLPHVFAKMNQLADIAGFYKAFGLTGSSETKERLDSLPAELEFMYYLILKQEFARSQGWHDKAERCRQAQQRFLEAHLGRWAATYCATLKKKASLPFYATTLEVAESFLAEEVRRLEAHPEDSAEIKKPVSATNTAECGGDCAGAPTA